MRPLHGPAVSTEDGAATLRFGKAELLCAISGFASKETEEQQSLSPCVPTPCLGMDREHLTPAPRMRAHCLLGVALGGVSRGHYKGYLRGSTRSLKIAPLTQL